MSTPLLLMAFCFGERSFDFYESGHLLALGLLFISDARRNVVLFFSASARIQIPKCVAESSRRHRSLLGSCVWCRTECARFKCFGDTSLRLLDLGVQHRVAHGSGMEIP